LITPPKIIISSGGKINSGFLVLTSDKIYVTQSANNNAYITGDACFICSTSNESALTFGPVLGNTVKDDDIIDST